MKKSWIVTASFLFSVIGSQGQSKISPDSIKAKMQWFADAKLGVFIHWGIYAVKGIDERWSFHNGKLSHEEYMKQK